MKKVFFFFLIVLLTGCLNEKQTPENIMSKKDMVAFLIDLHIVEAKINKVRIPNDTVKLFFPEIEQELYKKHNISDSIYLESYKHYLENVRDMEEIYAAVVDSLSLRERILNKKD